MDKERSILGEVGSQLLGILKDVAVGFVSIPFVSYETPKPKWCQCSKCGKWHTAAS
jgi:hypothetical protein